MARPLAPFAAFAVLVVTSSALAQQASIVPIVAPPSASQPFGKRVNDSGVVVGEAIVDGLPKAFRWSLPDEYLSLSPGRSNAYGVSENGNVICGVEHDGMFDRAVRWINGVPQDLGTLYSGNAGFSRAHAMTPDAAHIVGVASAPNNDHAFRYSGGAMQDLGSIVPTGFSAAEGVSADGSVVVGIAWTNAGWPHAFRWLSSTNVMEDLGTIGNQTGDSIALGVSADGSTIVGNSVSPSGPRGFVFTQANGMEALPAIGGDGSSFASGISADGDIITGASSSPGFPQPDACFWRNGQVFSLGQALFEAGVDLSGWSSLGDCRCSPSGEWFTGYGVYQGQQVAFLATFGPVLDPPRIDTWVTEGSAHVVRVGQVFQAPFVGTEPDGAALIISASGLPSGANLSPSPGAIGPSPMNAQLVFAPSALQFGAAFPISVSFQAQGGPVATRSFMIYVPPNETPTLGSMAARSIECLQGHHEVELASVVSDPEGFALNVTWKVDGIVRKTQSGVSSGSQVAFDFDFDHGTHTVTLEASDGIATGSAGTTVTVADTLDPIVIVAPDVKLPTDPGEDFATYQIAQPTVFDASGHPTTLEGDAPSTYPLGETIVTWTATDEAGNEGTATQKVTVEDQENPQIVGSASVQFFVDPGKNYSTQQPPSPTVSDNVDDPSQIVVTDDAPDQFPIGTTQVHFTATDGAGNSAAWTTAVTVVNRRPVANAGKDIVVDTKSEKGIRVVLDGRASFDPDSQPLKFSWSAPGARLGGKLSARPAGTFPVGKTWATLTVTDSVGAAHTDKVRVVVRLKNARPRPSGRDANRSFAAAAQRAEKAVAAKGSSGAALSGLASAKVASAFGDAAGEFVRWEEGQSEADALASYAELRAMQAAYGEAAVSALLSAYAETGDDALLSAYGYATYGTAYAAADLNER
jgi:probable HAF family extracellular repeat protein